ncbi:MAG: PEP-CTERM sorting domain-containing protein [Phycisphaeraceae bacterium]|nr:PEP-CTERM sorting domain-containing protein [Phycisphaeraceae bacterium]
MSRLNIKHVLTVMAGTCVGMSGAAQAGVIDLTPGSNTVAQWTLESSLSATTIGDNVASASNVGLTFSPAGSGFSTNHRPSADGGTYGDPPSPVQNVDFRDVVGESGYYFSRAWDESDIATATKALEFSISIADGYWLNLESVVADFGPRSSGPSAFRVVYSLDSSFTSEVFIGGGDGFIDNEGDAGMGYGADGSLNMVKGSGNFGSSWNRFVHDDLEGTEGQNLTGDVYFRIYAAGGGSGTDPANSLLLGNLTITGQVIPEPASLALLGVGGLLLLRRRP